MPQNTNNYSEQYFNLVCEVNILKTPDAPLQTLSLIQLRQKIDKGDSEI